MGSVFVNLLPLILGSAILPIWLIINIVLLMGANGTVKSAAFRRIAKNQTRTTRRRSG